MPPKKSTPKSKQPVIDPKSSFTPEAFEKELKNLAAKAQDETWSKFAQEQARVYLKSAALLALIGIYANVSALALSPIYGSIPVSIWHNKLVLAALFAGWSSNLYLNRIVPVRLSMLLPLIALYIPAVQFFLGQYSGQLTAYHGPLITEGLTLFPLIVVSVACTATTLEDADLGLLPGFLKDAAPGVLSYGAFKGVESLSGQWLMNNIGKSAAITRIGLESILGVCYALLAPSKFLLWTLPAVLHTAVLNTHVFAPHALHHLEGYLESKEWVLIDRKESITGYISVIDSMKDGFRVMRCDHSLLGGEWLMFQGGRVAEPVYGVFTMLEAVRLVETPKPIVDSEAKALVIGLGIGTLPSALVAHGVDTMFVEIDPVVTEFAQKHFRLPPNITAVTADAVSYTGDLARNGNVQYDYIAHDVFTGGAEPIELFTLEFLQGLNALLKPNGVIAINFAGDFLLPPPKIVVETIKNVFPSCRIFREIPRDDAAVEAGKGDFANMVIFCTKQEGSKLSFRAAAEADMLESHTRRNFLPPRNEVFDSDFTEEEVGILRRNETAKLAKWHDMSALGHWAVMRTVLPDFVWDNW